MRNTTLILLLSLIGKLFAQNLVPNNSFELFDTCPGFVGQIYYATVWSQPNPVSSTDFHHNCSAPGLVSVPYNVWGFQYPRSGDGYSGIVLYSSPNTREYLEIQLSQPLASGSYYCVEFYVCLSNTSSIATSAVGACLTNSFVIQSNSPTPFYVLNSLIPQIQNPSGNFILDTLNWTRVSGPLRAIGGEQYLLIGNFLDSSNTDTVTINGTNPEAYYYIDDVSVILCDTLPSESELFIPNAFSPNNDNNNDILHVRGPVKEMDLYIYDRWGELVWHGTDPSASGGWDGMYKGRALDAAVFTYYFRGTLTNGEVVTRKGNITLVK